MTEGDEVEDLLALVAFAKQEFPEIQAICSGAIASDYQRIRVESVCARLGLVSLAYLWHEPQSRLLDAMVAEGVRAVLIKVAAQGLKPKMHLGQDLAALRPHLWSLRASFGSNPCGEGGEYETLVLDCPLFRFASIVLDETEVFVPSNDAVCAVGILRIARHHLEPKDGVGEVPAGRVIEVPDNVRLPAPPTQAAPAPSCPGDVFEGGVVQCRVSESPEGAHVSCWARGTREHAGSSSVTATCRALGACLRQIESEALRELGLSWADCVFVRLYLRDLTHFASANQVYIQQVPLHEPPARACVELPDEDDCGDAVTLVRLEVIAVRPSVSSPQATDLRTLHVQSISRWAPSCIGPYAQAKGLGPLTLYSGVIPLDPPSMTVVGAGAAKDDAPRLQCERALLSAQRVAVAMGACLMRSALAFTVYCVDRSPSGPVISAAAESLQQVLLGRMHAWDPLAIINDPTSIEARGGENESDDEADFLGVHRRMGWVSAARDPAWDREFLDPPESQGAVPDLGSARVWTPLVLYVGLPALPRACLVEVEPIAVQLAALVASSSVGPIARMSVTSAGGATVETVQWATEGPEGAYPAFSSTVIRVAIRLSGQEEGACLQWIEEALMGPTSPVRTALNGRPPLLTRLYFTTPNAKLANEAADIISARSAATECFGSKITPALVPTICLAVGQAGGAEGDADSEVRTRAVPRARPSNILAAADMVLEMVAVRSAA